MNMIKERLHQSDTWKASPGEIPGGTCTLYGLPLGPATAISDPGLASAGQVTLKILAEGVCICGVLNGCAMIGAGCCLGGCAMIGRGANCDTVEGGLIGLIGTRNSLATGGPIIFLKQHQHKTNTTTRQAQTMRSVFHHSKEL